MNKLVYIDINKKLFGQTHRLPSRCRQPRLTCTRSPSSCPSSRGSRNWDTIALVELMQSSSEDLQYPWQQECPRLAQCASPWSSFEVCSSLFSYLSLPERPGSTYLYGPACLVLQSAGLKIQKSAQVREMLFEPLDHFLGYSRRLVRFVTQRHLDNLHQTRIRQAPKICSQSEPI